MINDIWYMIYSCAWIYLGWSYQMYTLLSEYRKKRFEENARVNPFVSPCPKTCCRTNTLWTNLCHLTQPSVCPSWKRSAFCGFIFSGCIFEDGWIGWGCMHLRLSEIGQGEVTLSKWAPFLFCGTACYMNTESKKHATSCTHGRLTFEGLIKLSLNWNINTGARTREPKPTMSLCH